MSGYTWSVSAGGTITSGVGTNAISVTWNTAGPQTVTVGYTDLNSCVTLIPTVFNVTVNPLPVITIGGPVSVCAASTGNVYTAPAGMTNYLWTVSAGGTITAGGGTASNTVTVTWNSAGTQTVSVNYTNANSCTALAPIVYTVTVNALPVPVIAGAPGMCLNTTGIYTTDPGMSGYFWTVSSGGLIVGGQSTNSVSIQWITNGAQTITVNYTNANGCTSATPSTFNVTVNTLPVPTISGLISICSGLTTTYNTEAAMSNYSWTVSAGGSITAGGGLNDDFVTVTWNTVGVQTVSVNYFSGIGCTAGAPTVQNVTVMPRPLVTNSANFTICSGTATNIPLFASLLGSTFTWTATGSSANVTGFSASGGQTISQVLLNSGFTIETVDYSVVANLNGCDGPVAHFIVTVDPVANAFFNPNGQTLCSGTTTSILIQSNVIGANFTYTATGGPDVTGFGPGVTASISQTLTNTGTAPEIVTYTINPSFNGCPGTPNSVVVTVNPLPVVSYTACNDVITTTAAQAIKLKGGLPLGGTYSGGGVSLGYFNPAIAGIGNHTITYTYPNTWGCIANATQMITVVNPPAFICDNTMTDIRDNKTYPTVKIGAQCWMAANLNFGNYIVGAQMQRDNCIPEKYCTGDNVANCTSFGGLYQWDEMMLYDNVAAAQGFCPPGWHIPTENEWTALFNFYTSNGFAGAPLKSTGYSGFNADISGTRFNNVNWFFNNFAVMFWSSSQEAPDKAWAHGMNYYNPSVSYYPGSRTHALSIRCIKD
jgi:uncharacterized protein (TIGR02145 family)